MPTTGYAPKWRGIETASALDRHGITLPRISPECLEVGREGCRPENRTKHPTCSLRIPLMARVIAVANQKGGVGKTTTVQCLGRALEERCRSVLLVDLDPQACLTYSLGFDPEALDISVHDVFVRSASAADAVVSASSTNAAALGSGASPELLSSAREGSLDLLPATIDLAGSEVHLLARTGREQALARALAGIMSSYDVVLIDCPPSLGVLTINGLSAADEVVIPLQCEALSLRGVGQLMATIQDVRDFTGSRVEVRGIIATMLDERTRHGREILENVREQYKVPVLEPSVPKSIRFAEAPRRGLSLLEHAPRSPGALAYREIAAQIDPGPRTSSGRKRGRR